MPTVIFPIVNIVSAAEVSGTLPPVSQTQSDALYGRYFFAPNANDRIVIHRGSQFNGVFIAGRFVVYRSPDAGVTWFANGLSSTPTGILAVYSVAWDGANALYITYSAPNAASNPRGLWFVAYDLTTDTFGSPVDLGLFYGREISCCWRAFDSTIVVLSNEVGPVSGLFEMYLTRLDITGTVLSTNQVNQSGSGTGDIPGTGRICEGDSASGLVHLLTYELNGTGFGNTQLAFQTLDASNSLSPVQLICNSSEPVNHVSNPNHDMCYDPATNTLRIIYSNYDGEFIASGPVPENLKLRVLSGVSLASTVLTLEGTVQAPGVSGTDFIDESAIAITASDPTIGIFWHMNGGGAVTVGTYQSLNYQTGVFFTGTDGNEFNFQALPLDNIGNYAFCWYQRSYVQGVLLPPTGGTYTFSHNGRIAQRRRTVLAV